MKDEDFEEIPVGKAEDLRGQKFGRLTALYRTENNGRNVCWVCRCDCGNKKIVPAAYLKRGSTTSCGCAYREDLIGQRFGRLVVLKYHHTGKDRHVYWECQCDCGNKVIVRANDLKAKHTTSCGCYQKEARVLDLVGKKFRKLTVIKREGSSKSGHALWLCQCDCGSKIVIRGSDLRSHHTISCGCVQSYGETVIAEILQENNILFEREKKFDNCLINKNKARFDFYVNDQYIIEFDGEQHFQSHNSGWNTRENLVKVQQSDAIKNKYCIDNNIPLIRIPYWHKDNIVLEDLLLETTKFLYKEN